MKRKHSLLSHFLQILLLLLLITSAFMGYHSISEKVDKAVAEMKRDLIGQLEAQYSIRLEYDSISPSFLSSILVKDVKIYAEGQSEPLLQIEKLKLYHDLPGLLFRGTTVISSVNALGLKLEIDEQRDKVFVDKITSLQGGGGFQGLNGIFTQYIRIRTWEASYSNEALSAAGKGDSISLRQLGDYVRVSMDGQVRYKSFTGNSQFEYISLETALKGTVQNDLSAFSMDSDFRKIDTNLAIVENQRLNINYSEDQFRITKIKDTKPYDFNLTVDQEEIRMSFVAEDFSPSRLIYFNSELENLNPWLETSMSGNADFLLQRETGFIEYSYDGALVLSNEKLPFPVRVSMDVEGDDLHVISEELRVSTPRGSANLVGQWVYQNGFPEGSVRLSNINIGEDEKISGELLLRNIDEYLSISSRNLRLSDGSNPGSVKSLIYRNEKNYVFSLMTDLAPDNGHRDRVVLDGNFSMADGFSIQSSFRAGDVLVSSLFPYIPQGVAGTLEKSFSGLILQSEGTLSFSSGNLMVQLNRFQSFMPDGSRSISMSGFYGDKKLDLYSVEMVWDGNYLLGSGQGRSLGQGLSISSGWNLNNNKYELNALYQNGQLSVKGNHGLKLQLAQQGGSNLLGTFTVSDFPVTWNGQDILGSMNIRGRYEDENWEAFLSDSSFKWTNSKLLSDPELNLTAFFAPGVVNIFSLNYGDSYSQLKGEGSLFYDIESDIYNGSLVLGESGSGQDLENYDIYAAYSDGKLSLTTQVNQARTERFSSLNMTGRVDSIISVQGSLDSPVVEGSIDAPQLEMNENPFAVKANLRLSSNKLELYDLNIQRNNLYLKRGLGVFDLTDGSLVFTTSIANRADSEDDSQNRFYLETGFSVKAETGLSIDLNNIEVPVLEDFSGRFRVHPVKWNGLTTFASKTVDFSRKGSFFESILLEDPEQFIRYDSGSGKISANLKKSFPLAMSVNGRLSADEIDLDIENLTVDLNMVNYVMPNDTALENRYVVFKKGSVMEGSAHIGGTMEDPVFNGKLGSKDLFVLTPYTEAKIEETFIEATIVDDLVETNEFFIPIGKGGIRAQGYMTMRGWGIKDYSLDISAEGSPGTPIAYNAYGLQGTGAITGQFRFHGDNRQGNFEGKVVLDELVGSFGEKTEIKARNKNRRNRYAFRLDLDIVTGKNVLFVLPNPQVELVRATAEPGELLNISVDSLNKTLSMTGGITIRDGEIYYFDRTFEITDGSLSFNEDEDTFNPFLNIEAEIDTNDASGSDVTIYLVYRNPVRDDFIPILRSNPSMPVDEITALFGQSLIPVDSSGQVDVSSLLLATGGMVSQYGFVRPLEQSLKDSLNLDTVTIRTEILENAIIDQLNRESSTTDAGTTFSMTKYLDDTSLYLGKFVGESLYFSAGLVVDYDQLYGLGSYLNGVKFVPDLTIEMRTPFFLVFWNYNKRNAFDFHNTDPMKNNAIGFEWRYSY